MDRRDFLKSVVGLVGISIASKLPIPSFPAIAETSTTRTTASAITFKWTAKVPISQELFDDWDDSVESLIRQDLEKALRDAEERYCLGTQTGLLG